MTKQYEIEIKASEYQTKEGKKFMAFKALNNEGRYVDCKFRKEVTPPKGSGLIVVEAGKLSLDKNRKYPVLWVHEVVKFIPFDQVVSTDNKQVDEMFAGNELVEDDTTERPF